MPNPRLLVFLISLLGARLFVFSPPTYLLLPRARVPAVSGARSNPRTFSTREFRCADWTCSSCTSCYVFRPVFLEWIEFCHPPFVRSEYRVPFLVRARVLLIENNPRSAVGVSEKAPWPYVACFLLHHHVYPNQKFREKVLAVTKSLGSTSIPIKHPRE